MGVYRHDTASETVPLYPGNTPVPPVVSVQTQDTSTGAIILGHHPQRHPQPTITPTFGPTIGAPLMYTTQAGDTLAIHRRALHGLTG